MMGVTSFGDVPFLPTPSDGSWIPDTTIPTSKGIIGRERQRQDHEGFQRVPFQPGDPRGRRWRSQGPREAKERGVPCHTDTTHRQIMPAEYARPIENHAFLSIERDENHASNEGGKEEIHNNKISAHARPS